MMVLTTREMPQYNTFFQDPDRTLYKHQDTNELVLPPLPRQNKVGVFHAPFPQGEKLSPYGPGEDYCFDIYASNAIETRMWLTKYGLVPVIFIRFGSCLVYI